MTCQFLRRPNGQIDGEADTIRVVPETNRDLSPEAWQLHGTYTYAINLMVSPERYATISSQLKSLENIILTHARALIRHNPNVSDSNFAGAARKPGTSPHGGKGRRDSTLA